MSTARCAGAPGQGGDRINWRQLVLPPLTQPLCPLPLPPTHARAASLQKDHYPVYLRQDSQVSRLQCCRREPSRISGLRRAPIVLCRLGDATALHLLPRSRVFTPPLAFSWRSITTPLCRHDGSCVVLTQPSGALFSPPPPPPPPPPSPPPPVLPCPCRRWTSAPFMHARSTPIPRRAGLPAAGLSSECAFVPPTPCRCRHTVACPPARLTSFRPAYWPIFGSSEQSPEPHDN